MRHPTFLGLRGDKRPMEVVLEKEVTGPHDLIRASHKRNIAGRPCWNVASLERALSEAQVVA
jgi:hypothetical protein